MEFSGNGPSASGHRHHAGGVLDMSTAVGCMREGHGPDCPECHEFVARLQKRVVAAWRLHLFSADTARCAMCTVRAFARIRDDVLGEPEHDGVVSVAYIARIVDDIVCEQFVADLRARQNDAWRACDLRLLQLACVQFGHGFGMPSADTEVKAASATVFTSETSDHERELIWEAQYKAKRGMLRHFRQGKEVLTIEGLMHIAVETAAKSVKGKLKKKGDFAGDENPDRAITLSALTTGSREDGDEGPAFEIAAPDDTSEQALEESEADIRARLIERLTSFLEEQQQQSNRPQTTTPRQRAGMIIDALTNPDLDGNEIARRYGVKRSYVYVQKDRFRDLLADPAWHDRLVRLFGANPADWPLSQDDAPTQPPAADTPAPPLTADTLTPPPDADTADTGNLADPADATSAQHAPTTLHGRPVPPDTQQPAGGRDSLRQDVSQDDSLASLRGAEDADG